jgi:23S rRNA (guanosine2251-2'-O)-methyltransferase
MIIYGVNPVRDFVSFFPEKISRVFLSEAKMDKSLPEYSEIISKIPLIPSCDIEYVSEKELQRMTNTVKHQSIAAIIDIDPPKNFKDLKEDIKNMTDIVLILDHLNDPQNLGAISRTCVFFNINTIIIPKNRSVRISLGAIKASAGAIFSINIYEVSNLINAIKELKKNNYWIIGTDINGENINDKKFNKFKGDRLAIIMGSEQKGISRIVQKSCDVFVKINRLGKTNSLNVSVAAGIFISRFLDD